MTVIPTSSSESDRAERGKPRLRALLLAGSLRSARSTPIAQALGIPVGALPIDASHCSMSLLVDRLLRERIVSSVAIAVSEPTDRLLYELIAEESGYKDRVHVWADTQPHRGPAGIVRDYCDDQLPSDATFGNGLLVLECSSYMEIDFARVVSAFDPSADASVVTTRDLRPCGVVHLSHRSIVRIPQVGFYDLKQQLIKAIGDDGGKTLPLCGDFESWRISDLQSYLAVLRRRSALGELMRSPRARIDPTSILQGTVLVARDAVIQAGAFISDSAILPSAVVGDGAVIARSVIPPGTHVPSGARVVDQVFATFLGLNDEVS